MSNEIKIKLRYTFNNVITTREITLNCKENLEKSFNSYIYTLHLQNIQNVAVFHLIRGNERILLDKHAKIENLNLKDGDLISVSFQEFNNNIPNIHTNHNLSSANLNEENNQNINNNSVRPNKNKIFFILIFALIAIIIIGIGLFLIIHLTKKKKKTVNIQEKSDNKENDINNDNGNNNGNDNGNVNGNNNGYSNGAQNQTEKIYSIEELISEKRPYYPINMLYLFKSDKNMKVSISGGQGGENDDENNSLVKEFMNFGLLIRDENEEIVEEKSIKKKWFTGYISLLNY